jgi:hypothetical protein
VNNASPARLSRDIRVTRGWRRARSRNSRMAAFVAAILARHVRGLATLFGPERVMRRHPGQIVSATHHHHSGDTMHFAPRFDIKLMPVTRTRVMLAPLSPWRPAANRETAMSPRAAARHAGLQRIFAREQRVPTSTTMREILREVINAPVPAGAAPTPNPTRPAAPPLQMVVHSSRAAAREASRAPAGPTQPEQRERNNPTPLFRPPSATSQPSLSALELGRVTDHVVRALDQRLVSHRERRGRI